MNKELDRQGENPHPPKEIVDLIRDIQHDFNIIDTCIWRLRNPLKPRYTLKQTQPLIQSRLDIWFVSETVHDFKHNVDIVPGTGSDHSAIWLEIRAVQTQNEFLLSNVTKFRRMDKYSIKM